MRKSLSKLLAAMIFAAAGAGAALFTAPPWAAAQPSLCSGECTSDPTPCVLLDANVCSCKPGRCWINEKGNIECEYSCTYNHQVYPA